MFTDACVTGTVSSSLMDVLELFSREFILFLSASDGGFLENALWDEMAASFAHS